MRHALRFFLLTFVLIASSCHTTNERDIDPRPNIVVFLADDLGVGDLGSYGHPFLRTPHLDRLAREGMRYTQCYAGSAICSPARAALLTGRNPFRVGIYHLAGDAMHLPRSEVTVAELLQNAGYQTCFVGKWHLSNLKERQTPREHGFDHWFASQSNTRPTTKDPVGFVRNGVETGEIKGWNCDIIVDEAMEWLEKRDPSLPFFLEVCSSEPHTPVTPPDKDAALYEDPQIDELETTIRYGGVDRPTEGVDISGNKKYYYGTVTQLDRAFGRLVTALEEQGLSENTVVIFTSDNGPEHPGGETRKDPGRDRCFGTPGKLRGMKRYLYEGGIRVPGIVRWPRHVPADSVSAEPISAVDILPTACALAGITPPTSRPLDGVSILPTFRGEPLQREVPLFWTMDYAHIPQVAMRVADHVIVGHFNAVTPGQSSMNWIKTARLEKFELYDLNADPGQENDLAGPEPALFKALRGKMLSLWAEVQNEGPIWEDWTTPPKPRFPLWWKS